MAEKMENVKPLYKDWRLALADDSIPAGMKRVIEMIGREIEMHEFWAKNDPDYPEGSIYWGEGCWRLEYIRGLVQAVELIKMCAGNQHAPGETGQKEI